MRRAVRQVPRPLALLLVVVALFGVAWALIVPAWQNPDEDVHFAYSQTLAERHELPGKPGRPPVSSEQRLSMTDTNTDAVVFLKIAKPEWSTVADRAWRAQTPHTSRKDGGGGNAAAAYPPAYYLYETLPYELTRSSDVLTRLYTMRVFSLLWLLVSTVGAWLLAGEVLGRRRPLQLVAAATVGLWPMVTFVSAAVNPDSLLIAVWTLSLWLEVAIVKRGLTLGRGLGLGAVVGIGLVTKATALALIPAALFALGVAAVRTGRRLTRRQLVAGTVAVAAIGLPVLAWIVVAHGAGNPAYSQADELSRGGGSGGGGGAPAHAASLGNLVSYVWQFYLPRVPPMEKIHFFFPVIGHYAAYNTWLGMGWAVFGWANVWFPSPVYIGFLIVALLVAGLALAPAVRGRLRGRGAGVHSRLPDLRIAGVFALSAGALLAGLHWTDFHMWASGSAPFLQGRYVLPLAALMALVMAKAVQALPVRLAGVGVSAVLGGLVVFQSACLLLVTLRYFV